MKTYLIIRQTNLNVPCMRADGKVYVSLRHYVPHTLDEARYLVNKEEDKSIQIIDKELRPSADWGSAVYEVNKYGTVNRSPVDAQWDSSG